ncbi:MAG: hypothetical protein BWY60_00998 [Actinobacteria bacterium ADurb.Bin346]|nr:MAG: hypothetical protein BWY60_00998 [Actinobacteria bacterium ADurb.Bin346]
MDRVKIENFYRLWVSQIDKLLSGYIFNEAGNPNPTRYIFSFYLELIERFLKDEIIELEKINLLSGIRGIGKTTLLGQLFYASRFINHSSKNYSKLLRGNYEKLYLDVSKLHLEGISLNDFFKYYEEEKNIHFETIDRKFIILLDEVHYDDNWGLFLKNIFDRVKGHKNILIIATGSSALKIKLNPDLSRRSLILDLYPLKFDEYLIMKNIAVPIKDLSEELVNSILFSNNAADLHDKLKVHSKEINSFFLNLAPSVEEEFLYYGGFPFVLELKDKKHLIYKLVNGVIDNLITKDILDLKKFASETISKIKDLLYLIANSDATDYEKLCSALKLDYRSARGIIETLIQSGIILEVKSYGEKFVKVRKPAKFLFISPSLRVSILSGIIPSEIKGKLLEDYLGLLFKKEFLKKKISAAENEILYDSSSMGADFILRAANSRQIIVEVGFGEKKTGIRQVENTAKKLDNFFYGIIVSKEGELQLINEKIIRIPLKFWMLI